MTTLKKKKFVLWRMHFEKKYLDIFLSLRHFFATEITEICRILKSPVSEHLKHVEIEISKLLKTFSK